jgi:hypothetical protein
MSNPFEVKRFYIRESPLKPCGSLPLPSRITLKDTSISGIIKNTDETVKDLSSNGPLSLLEIKQYLSDETTKFYVQAELAKSCDSAGLALNGLAGAKASSIPPACSTNFDNFSKQNLGLIQMAINNKRTAFTSQMSNGSNPFMNFKYTPEYLVSKRTENDKKELCQRYADIGQLLADFLAILKTINNNPQKTAFTDKYAELMKIYKNNGHLRAELQNKLDHLTNSVYYQDSKEFLDSTVYINVLWTILATTSIFYIFKSLND